MLSGSAIVTGIAWWYVIAMTGHHMHLAGWPALFAMWSVMMTAMMLPSTLPFVFAFTAEQRRRRTRSLAAVPAAFFVVGYLALWLLFSAACALLQVFLHERTLLSPAMSSTSSLFSGAILIAAGVYQWTPAKNACLRHCRSPLTFLLSDWREGIGGALRMGADHALFCIGCCWMLMLLPFSAGVMNLTWMAGITVILLLEKAVPGGEVTARVFGALLTAGGACVIYFKVAL